MDKIKSLKLNPPVIALLLAVALFFLGGIIQPGFLNINQAFNILRLAAFLGIIAAGQTLVILSGGEGIDLSIGAVVTLAAILTFRINDGQNELVPLAMFIALLAGTFIGLLNGIGVAFLKVPPLVMTLGMAGVVQGLILAITQGEMIGDTAPVMGHYISSPLVLGIPGIIFIWFILAGLIWLLLERSAYGKQLYAIGVNRTTARLSGVRVPIMVIVTYTLSGLLAAFGGFMLLGFTQTVFMNLGGPYLFPSVAAVVVGGTVLSGGKGSYWGTMAGALVLTLITSLLTTMQLPQAFRQMTLGAILLVLISVYGRQRGLRQ
jgi:ribose transport system permease protein